MCAFLELIYMGTQKEQDVRKYFTKEVMFELGSEESFKCWQFEITKLFQVNEIRRPKCKGSLEYNEIEIE